MAECLLKPPVVRTLIYLKSAASPQCGIQLRHTKKTFQRHHAAKAANYSALTRLRNFGNISGEFCVCKLIVSTCAGQTGATHLVIVTKSVANPSKISLDSQQLQRAPTCCWLLRESGH